MPDCVRRAYNMRTQRKKNLLQREHACSLALLALLSLAAMSCGDMLQRAKYESTLLTLKKIDAQLTKEQVDRYPPGSSLDVVLQIDSSLPTRDAWGTPLRYFGNGEEYWLASASSDRVWEHDNVQEYSADGHNGYDADAVVHNGRVVHGRYLGVELENFEIRD